MSQTLNSRAVLVLAYHHEQLEEMTTDALRIVHELGASDAATEISEGQGLSAMAHRDEVETIEQSHNKVVGVTVMLGKKRSNASMSDFSPAALRPTAEAAYNIVWFIAGDDCAGLTGGELLEKYPQDLQLYHPWMIDAEVVAEITRVAEAATFVVSPKIRNSDGPNISVQHSHFVLAASCDFMGGYPYSHYLISAAPIAESGVYIQRGNWYSSKRSPDDLVTSEAIGKYVAEHALVCLSARRLTIRKCPVLLEVSLTAGLLGTFVQAVSGDVLYRKSIFLLNTLGKEVFTPHMQVTEDPYVLNGMGSASFDGEGVRTQRHDVVKNGVVEGYLLSTYSACKLGMQTTGNAGGPYNLTLFSDKTTVEDNLAGMLRCIDTGLLVTELMGQGVSYVTGDYSHDASDYWVENGVIQCPVEEITIVGNLCEMFHQTIAIDTGALVRGTKKIDSILAGQMTITGE